MLVKLAGVLGQYYEAPFLSLLAVGREQRNEFL